MLGEELSCPNHRSRHIKRVRKQLHDTLIRRVAGPVKQILNSLIHQRNGLMWSNSRSSTGEAAAMRPRSAHGDMMA